MKYVQENTLSRNKKVLDFASAYTYINDQTPVVISAFIYLLFEAIVKVHMSVYLNSQNTAYRLHINTNNNSIYKLIC